MGLLDRTLDAAKQVLSGSQTSDLGQSLVDMLGTQLGGVQGLAQMFEEKGLAGVMASWVGTGANQTISADQLAEVLGPERIAQLAAKVGISPDRAQQVLAQLVPSLIDHLTPNGQIPQGGDLIQSGLAALKKLIG